MNMDQRKKRIIRMFDALLCRAGLQGAVALDVDMGENELDALTQYNPFEGPRVVLSKGIIERMSMRAILGVFGHELGHILNGDMGDGLGSTPTKEFAADKKSAELLRSPKPMIDSLLALQAERGESDFFNQMLFANKSTHPPVQERISRLEKLAPLVTPKAKQGLGMIENLPM